MSDEARVATALSKHKSDVARVLGFLFLGNRRAAKDRGLLSSLGVTHILNLTPTRDVDKIAGVPNYFAKDSTLTYKRCSLFDSEAEDITNFFKECFAFINSGKHYGNVLVHCNKGVSRSATVVIAFLIKERDFSLDEAMEFVQAKRKVVNPNSGFRKQLRKFEDNFKRSSAAQAAETAARTTQQVSTYYGVIGAAMGPQPTTSPVSGPTMPPSFNAYKPGDVAQPTTPPVSGPTMPPSFNAYKPGDVAQPTTPPVSGPTMPPSFNAHKLDEPKPAQSTTSPVLSGPNMPPSFDAYKPDEASIPVSEKRSREEEQEETNLSVKHDRYPSLSLPSSVKKVKKAVVTIIDADSSVSIGPQMPTQLVAE